MLNTVIFAFVLYFILSISYFEELKGKEKTNYLVFVCIIFAIIIGNRDPLKWSDTGAYLADFIENAKPFGALTNSDGPGIYKEKWFYYIGVVSKTISNSSTLYFMLVSSISMFFLGSSLKKYAFFPFIGLFIYYGRFVARDTIQIRAAIAIAIIIFGTIYVTKRQLWKYLLVVFIASRFHTSAYLALPLYFLNSIEIKKIHIYWGIFISLVVAQFYGGMINNIVSQSDIANEWATSYVQEGSEKAFSNDLTNPVIWYQIAVLLVFTVYEEKLAKYTEHYYTIRNAYLYSTAILIILCQYAILAARLSTIFATYEMIMVPLFVLLLKGNSRRFALLFIGAFYLGLFYINIRKYL